MRENALHLPAPFCDQSPAGHFRIEQTEVFTLRHGSLHGLREQVENPLDARGNYLSNYIRPVTLVSIDPNICRG